LLVADIDTDMISPGHSGKKTPEEAAFAPMRYRADGSDDPAFVLNQTPFRGAPILLASENFGCGSSRETAVWALRALGIRCVIAVSFGDIFFQNCFPNGVLPIVCAPETVTALAAEAATGDPVEVDLQTMVIRSPRGRRIAFTLDPTRRRQLLEGLDDIDATLLLAGRIDAFQQADRIRRPWIHDVGPGPARS